MRPAGTLPALLASAGLLAAQRQPLEFSIQWVNALKPGTSALKHRTLRSERMKREVGYSIYLPLRVTVPRVQASSSA